MIRVQSPDKYHPGFNPIVFIYQPETEDTSVSLTIIVRNKAYTVSREFSGGQNAVFDLSGVIMPYFSMKSLAVVGENETIEDDQLSVSYRVIDPLNPDGEDYIAMNGVAQTGQSDRWGDKLNTLLTAFDTIKVYEGYSRDVSELRSDGVYRTDINAYVDFLTDNEGNYITNRQGDRIVLAASIPMVNSCTPPAPFYVRWINTIGGVDYWMFQKRQQFKTSLKESTTASIYNPASSLLRQRIDYSIEVQERLVLGADNLSAKEYLALSQLPYSPVIEYYDTQNDTWIPLTASKTDSEMRTDQVQHSIELEFDMPQYNTQRVW